MKESESIARLRGQYIPAVVETTRQVLGDARTSAKVEELALIAGRYADDEILAWRARPDAPGGIACRAGCSSCCHAPVGITVPEAILISGVLRDEEDEAGLAAILERSRNAEAARTGVTGRTRDLVRFPCPLLDPVDGSCSIYEFRPLNCRGWNSFDLTRCESYFDLTDGPSTIPIDGIQRAIGLAIAEGTQLGLEMVGLDGPTVDLAAALRIVLEDPEAPERWLKGEPAFRQAEV